MGRDLRSRQRSFRQHVLYNMSIFLLTVCPFYPNIRIRNVRFTVTGRVAVSGRDDLQMVIQNYQLELFK